MGDKPNLETIENANALEQSDSVFLDQRTSSYLKLPKKLLERALYQSTVAIEAQQQAMTRLEQRAQQTVVYSSAMVAASGPFLVFALGQSPKNIELAVASIVTAALSAVGALLLFVSMTARKKVGFPGLSPSIIDLTNFAGASDDDAIRDFEASVLALNELKYEQNARVYANRSLFLFWGILSISLAPIAGGGVYLGCVFRSADAAAYKASESKIAPAPIAADVPHTQPRAFAKAP